MESRCLRLAVLALLALAPAGSAPAQLVLDEPLQGSTTGARSGGAFSPRGFRITGKDDSITWHIRTVSHGAAEWEVTGLRPGECRAGLEDHAELFHMYDHSYANSDSSYNPGYRDNPYKHFVRKQGCIDIAPDRMKLVWKIGEAFEEPGTSPLSWDPARTYRFREEWGPDGAGNAVIRLYRDGALLLLVSLPGPYAPAGHSVRIGASSRRDAAAGAPLDAVFSNLKVWDLEAGPPPAPTLARPQAGAVLVGPRAFLSWNAAGQSRFQARVSTRDDPEGGVVWDSREAASSQGFIHAGPLSPGSYFAFVRAGNAVGFGPWSSPGRPFRIDPAAAPGPDLVRLEGNTLADAGGPFLGLGASYFSALRLCRSDRARLRSDLDFLRSQGFRFVRVLSMVGWNSSWQGLEIAPVSFQSQNGTPVAAWPDYWQQFRDLIDIVDERGLRTQVTIFADAQLMPAKAARLQHMAALLSHLAGREHKVILLEVGNEAWQNGFPGAQGIADLREFGKYLADRTTLPVALSAPPAGSNAELTELYQGSAADIATVHFTRDLGTPEGGWLPVRDPWRVELAAGVPPASSNEPIGPGSSVNRETDPVKLAMAAAFAWGANLPLYVFHSSAGVRSLERFQDMAGVGGYARLAEVLPPDFASWPRNDGKEPSSPFTVFAEGQANRTWPEVPGARSGVVMSTGKVKGAEFVTLPIGILDGGVVMEARRPVSFQVIHPLTGLPAAAMARARGERFTLSRGPGAYILKGFFTDVPGGAMLPPRIEPVLPSPETAPAGVEYRRSMRLLQGHPAPAWTLLQGPPGMRIDSSGLVRGWTPAPGDVGRTFPVRVRAENDQGSDEEAFEVTVAVIRETLFPFNAGNEGWALSVWKSGPYEPGTAAWDPAGGNPGGNLRSSGSGESNNADTCTREGSSISRVLSTAGLGRVAVEFEVSASLAGPPGPSGTGACPVLQGTGEDKLVVSYSTRGLAGPWTAARVLAEPELPAAFRTESVDLSGVGAAGDNPAFAIRFEWQFNARTDTGRLDNVRLRGVLLAPPPPRFRRGDPSADRATDLADAILILGFLFLGDPAALGCEKSADTDDSGRLDLADAVALLAHLFFRGPAPPPPFTACGVDPTGDALGCGGHPACP